MDNVALQAFWAPTLLLLLAGIHFLLVIGRMEKLFEEIQKAPSGNPPTPANKKRLQAGRAARMHLLRRAMQFLIVSGSFLGFALFLGHFLSGWLTIPGWLTNTFIYLGAFFLLNSWLLFIGEIMGWIQAMPLHVDRRLLGLEDHANASVPPMRIIFEFAGGPLDGKTVDGILGDQGEADRFYLLTNRGSVGQRFKLASDYAIEILSKTPSAKEAARLVQRHVYQVSDRLDAENEVLVRAEYVPKG